VHVAFPSPGPAVRVQVGDRLNVPTPFVVKVIDPVGVVGAVEGSLTVAVQLDGAFTATEPGLHVIDVVVRCELDGFVALSSNAPELPVWLPLPSPSTQTNWYGGVPPVGAAVKLMLPPRSRLGGFQVKSEPRTRGFMLGVAPLVAWLKGRM